MELWASRLLPTKILIVFKSTLKLELSHAVSNKASFFREGTGTLFRWAAAVPEEAL